MFGILPVHIWIGEVHICFIIYSCYIWYVTHEMLNRTLFAAMSLSAHRRMLPQNKNLSNNSPCVCHVLKSTLLSQWSMFPLSEPAHGLDPARGLLAAMWFNGKSLQWCSRTDNFILMETHYNGGGGGFNDKLLSNCCQQCWTEKWIFSREKTTSMNVFLLFCRFGSLERSSHGAILPLVVSPSISVNINIVHEL